MGKANDKVKTVGLIGGGVIGSAWAARLLINGIDVNLYDPAEGVERRIHDVLDNALRAYRAMTLAPVDVRGRLSLVDSIEAAVSDADFVQESGPERIEVKKALIHQICSCTGAGVIVPLPLPDCCRAKCRKAWSILSALLWVTRSIRST